MTTQQKNNVNGWLTWLARGVLIYFAAMINGKLEDITKLQTAQDKHEIRIFYLEQGAITTNADIRNTQNRVNRLERAVRFKREDAE